MNCKLCGAKLKTEREKDKKMCKECIHHGFTMLGKVLGNMKQKYKSDDESDA